MNKAGWELCSFSLLEQSQVTSDYNSQHEVSQCFVLACHLIYATIYKVNHMCILFFFYIYFLVLVELIKAQFSLPLKAQRPRFTLSSRLPVTVFQVFLLPPLWHLLMSLRHVYKLLRGQGRPPTLESWIASGRFWKRKVSELCGRELEVCGCVSLDK